MSQTIVSSPQGPISPQPCVFPPFIRKLSDFLYGTLQELNDDIEVGKSTIGDFLAAWEPTGRLLADIVPLISRMGESQARDLLRRIAFVPSSIEFHAQRAGE